MRDLSTNALTAINSQETDEIFLTLLTISHGDLSTPYYFVNNTVDIVSRGNTFIAYPFDLPLPDSIGESIPNVSLKIDNVDRRIVDTLRSFLSPPSLKIEVVLASSPDIVELGPLDMIILKADYDVMLIEAMIVYDNNMMDLFPSDRYIPSLFPGLF